MSWSQKITNNLDKKIKKIKKIKNKPKSNNISKKNLEIPKEEIFELLEGADLFDYIFDLKTNCEKYTPDLFSKITSVELYFFFRDYINITEYDLFNDYSSDEEYEDELNI